MEIIRNYLESMFANMPNTAEVQRAKNELLQMMEDKYNELISAGKNENEAVGTVISQFGNLDELSGELGLSDSVQGAEDISRRQVSLADARGYLTDSAQTAFLTALGVFLCITSSVGCILAAMSDFKSDRDIMLAVGVAMLFVFIAVAVGMFIFSSMKMKNWNYLKREPCTIDYSTSEFLKSQYENYRLTNTLMITFGVILIIVSIVPVSVISIIGFGNMELALGIGVVLLLIFVGLGVMMLIITGCKTDSYKTLLCLNDKNTVSGSYWNDDEVYEYKNKYITGIMSVYKETVVCIYLIWSFMTFDWHITWIIFPVAAVVRRLLNLIFANDNKDGNNSNV